jgi:hypothetical protein
MPVAEGKMDEFVRLQMQAIRELVRGIDLSGGPQGGNA